MSDAEFAAWFVAGLTIGIAAYFGLRIAVYVVGESVFEWWWGRTCSAAVIRRGREDRCGRRVTGVAYDDRDGQRFQTCAEHSDLSVAPSQSRRRGR